MPRKQEAQPVIPSGAECWEEVVVDLEGPSNLADRHGNRCTMTGMSRHSHRASPKYNASEARRMFANIIMRSGRLPSLVRTDRGPELKNALMQEYSAFVGLGRQFGTPWRPMEAGLVENVHKETQKIMGMMVKDVLKCGGGEVLELLHVVEFVVYNTLGLHGFTPRDIDRRPFGLNTP